MQQLKGQNSFVAHGPHHEHRLDLMFIKHLEDQNYDTVMVCVDVFTKYAAVVPVNGKSENVLALGVIESIAKMSKKPQVIYLDSESGIRNSRLFQKYFTENKYYSAFQQRASSVRRTVHRNLQIHAGQTHQSRPRLDGFDLPYTTYL